MGLYRVDDTITIFNGSPYYFTETDEDGQYIIENIKNGLYRIYAFNDENKNLKLETKNEAYGFFKDTLVLDTTNLTIDLSILKLDINPFKTVSATTSGIYFDVNFNKFITDFSITPIDFDQPLYANRAKEYKSIRFYNTFENKPDSIPVSIIAFDSLLTEYTDTVYVKFLPSRRKPDPFTLAVTPKDKSAIEPSLEITIDFSKPVIGYNTDSIFFRYDTTLITQVSDTLFHFNKYFDELTFKIDIDKMLIDTIIARNERLQQLKKDSLAVKKSKKPATPKKQTVSKKNKKKTIKPTGLQFYLGTGAFISADRDSSELTAMNYKFLKPEDYGTQKMTIETEYENFTVQLLSSDLSIYEEVKNQKSFTFKNIKPGEYRIRVFIDADNDGKWNPGNMLLNIEPEPVYIYPQTLVIRADWITSLNLTF